MLLPVIAKAFSKRAPLVELSLHAMEHTAMRGMLDAGELDACLTEIYTPPSASLQFTPIFKDYCVVATYDKYLKNKLILRPKHLDGQNILSGSSQSSYYAKLLRQVLQNHHVEVTIRPLFNNYTEIAARLQAESATTIIPAHLIASIPFGNAALIPFDCSELVHDFGILVHAKRMSPNLRTFVEVVRTEIPFRNYLLCSYPRLAAHADSASIQQSGLADSCGNILNC